MYTIDANGLINHSSVESETASSQYQPFKLHLVVLQLLRQWLDGVEIHNPVKARFFCKVIPAQCPFERDIWLFGRRVAHIPPLCKFNPFYEQLVSLRFRALCYLADQCGEDVGSYC
ncbi:MULTISPECIES: Mo-dependent nitrogenase C-terminal domain-containing protein [unclassified Coleofasciculus]|uniref:Mo-dependent nitrogenase C-terminal domain-containing protein n=1 Tax=unclassified Coleofasciculus TaxID=2692782 RepID=UPI0018825EE7|nr:MULTISPECIES: Mo-dependent nitrogenase C-terminal domain-containing protein [unclassified Coleofasciculus]MBE9129179.1 Mo-dependent nitrogenase C-terminal domain-containing protein [Coleofasciculus sp. LEGE 07081]MBE9151087.1 Mo-dependent nitrogenase C-terminal domain-containing protein [Coleofasciculus sp. LEGE 07092]